MKRMLSIPVALLMALPLAGTATAAQADPAQEQPERTCFGHAVTMLGSSGDDELQGEVGQVDVIWLGRGDDIVRSIGEDGPREDVGDLVCGGPGRDDVGGTAGDDRIAGGRGRDDVDGWRGADVLRGKAGNDRIVDDSIASQDVEDDVLGGGRGADVLVGGWGNDRLYGFTGGDTLLDLECDGPTRLFGGSGDDTIESYLSSFDGANCGDWTGSNDPDRVFGGHGADAATVLDNDTVRGVEDLAVEDYSG